MRALFVDVLLRLIRRKILLNCGAVSSVIKPRRRTNRILNRRTAGQSRRGWMVPAAVTRVDE